MISEPPLTVFLDADVLAAPVTRSVILMAGPLAVREVIKRPALAVGLDKLLSL
jgi:hypothetical protein